MNIGDKTFPFCTQCAENVFKKSASDGGPLINIIEINDDVEALQRYFGAYFNTNRNVFLKAKVINDRAIRQDIWNQIAGLYPNVTIKKKGMSQT